MSLTIPERPSFQAISDERDLMHSFLIAVQFVGTPASNVDAPVPAVIPPLLVVSLVVVVAVEDAMFLITQSNTTACMASK
jgi:hypothetical protein